MQHLRARGIPEQLGGAVIQIRLGDHVLDGGARVDGAALEHIAPCGDARIRDVRWGCAQLGARFV